MSSGQLLGQWIDVHAQNFVGRPNSDGGVGVVTREHDDGSFDIRYSVSNTCEKRIVRERVKSYNPLVLTARCLNDTDVERPSLLAPLYRPSACSGTQRPTAPRASPPEPPRGVSNILLESRNWSKYDAQHNSLLFYLREGKDKPKGWLRLVESEYNKYQKGSKKGEMMSHLSEDENSKLIRIKLELERIKPMVKEEVKEWGGFTPYFDLAHAYGVGRQKVRECVTKSLLNNCSMTRKPRVDVGHTIFNSQPIREKYFTPYNYYKKAVRKAHPGVIVSDAELKNKFNDLDTATLNECELGANEMKVLPPTLFLKLKRHFNKQTDQLAGKGWQDIAAGELPQYAQYEHPQQP